MIQAFLPLLRRSEHPGSSTSPAAPDPTATRPGAEAMGARPVAASVPGIVWAAAVPDDGLRGGFFRTAGRIPDNRPSSSRTWRRMVSAIAVPSRAMTPSSSPLNPWGGRDDEL
jgi:hypothetical protein